MRAEHILHKVLGEVAGLVHRARFRAVVEALALIDGARWHSRSGTVGSYV